MPGFVVTRGLGPKATVSNLIVRGFMHGGLLAAAARAFRGGRSELSRLYKDLVETIKISAKLALVNGKLVPTSIINNISRDYLEESIIKIKVEPRKIVSREVSDVEVTAKHVVKKRKLLK